MNFVVRRIAMEKTETSKWKKIYESEKYEAEIYNNCTMLVYRRGANLLRLEIAGTKWSSNSGGFYTYRYFVRGEQAQELIEIISEYDEDEASNEDVDAVISGYCG
jgi:hypothetical protein